MKRIKALMQSLKWAKMKMLYAVVDVVFFYVEGIGLNEYRDKSSFS